MSLNSLSQASQHPLTTFWIFKNELLFSQQVVSNSLQPHGCSLPGSFVHGISQTRMLKWVAISSPGDLPYMNNQIENEQTNEKPNQRNKSAEMPKIKKQEPDEVGTNMVVTH